MASKLVEISGLGNVLLVKRRGSRHLRISVGYEGEIRVSLPIWMPYAAGIAFAKGHKPWIAKQQAKRSKVYLQSGQIIGRGQRLEIHQNQTVARRSKITDSKIEIWLAGKLNDADSQQKIRQTCERALKSQANKILLPRLDYLSKKHRIDYSAVLVKKMHSRWGSCSSKKEISLSVYLVQLSDELVDYVILHELTHTQLAHHGKGFWSAMERLVPDVKTQRKKIRTMQPVLRPL